MKKTLFILIPIIALTISACIKPDRLCCVLPQPQNSISSTINNNYVWVPTAIDSVKGDSIIVYGSTTTNFLRLKFNYKVTPQQSNVIIKDYSADYFDTMTSGQIVNTYVLDKTVPDTLSVVYSSDSKYIMGFFHLKFKIQNPSGGDTSSISFSNGRFTAVLNK